MRIGLYMDLRNPGAKEDWAELYAAALDRVVHAEQAGLDAVWTTEHHMAPDGYLSQPLTLLAALAARTSRVRLGTAVVVTPFRSDRLLAEEAALVDILSAGRLELGLGSGWDPKEFTAFGASHADRYRDFRRTLRALPGLWSDGTVTPGPVQDPVPLWYGARGPVGARWAGKLGVGLLWLDRDLLEPYLDGLDEGGHDRSVARMGGLANIVLCDDPERARSEIIEHARAARRATYTDAEPKGRPSALPKLQFLTVDQAVQRLSADLDGLPVTDVFLFDRIGGMSEELTGRHLELLTGPFRTGLQQAVTPRIGAAG
ncbi:LLM class flavin-dependent oxidoreductase [Nakamurella sp. YIM 132087]|uniref:LLM class flavin-dependent oxidoreductase n=1 Tax=Nakamurella alba TaxID=2665158 RepID=A0A7K1FIA2_9ACTN|nr:LLM class flavin-dependent oxidoreductase [Nakamurella alba]MTD13857.1 LLM class flavin-dependent oxidoreductase [Nakamurella alba]